MTDLFRAREAARSILRTLCVTSARQLVVEDLAMARGVFVHEGPLEGAEARLLRRGSQGVIRVREGMFEIGRTRFAVAHELGHWELHSHMTQWALCSGEDIETYKGSATELEANAFAGELLMPTALIRDVCEGATPSLEVVRSLANEFSTTLTATVLRFVEECRETCVAVFSAGRKVTWSRGARGVDTWIPPGYSVDQRSGAWELRASGAMEHVPTEAWFPEWRGSPRREVLEQTISLGRYGTALTLLWLIDSDDPDEDAT